MTRHLMLALAAGAVLGGAGCRNKQCRDCSPDPPPRYLGEPTSPRGGTIPPSNLPTAPPSTLPSPDLPPTRDSLRIDPNPPPTVDVPSSKSAPAKPDREVILPDGPPAAGAADRKPTGAGYLDEPLAGDRPPLPGGSAPTPTPSTSERPAAPAPAPSGGTKPAGLTLIPGRAGITSGRTPTDAGLDWLKANGYRTVIYLHAPDADAAKLKADAERRGLNVVAVAVAPETLKEALDKFAAAVGDRSLRPAYVADADGVRAGALWYLVFRTQDLASDEVARVRAAPLGLTADDPKFAAAVRNVLNKQ